MAAIEFDADDRPSVRLASGEVFEADVVVGTERTGSITRPGVVEEEVADTSLGMSVFKCVATERSRSKKWAYSPVQRARPARGAGGGSAAGAVAGT